MRQFTTAVLTVLFACTAAQSTQPASSIDPTITFLQSMVSNTMNSNPTTGSGSTNTMPGTDTMLSTNMMPNPSMMPNMNMMTSMNMMPGMNSMFPLSLLGGGGDNALGTLSLTGLVGNPMSCLTALRDLYTQNPLLSLVLLGDGNDRMTKTLPLLAALNTNTVNPSSNTMTPPLDLMGVLQKCSFMLDHLLETDNLLSRLPLLTSPNVNMGAMGNMGATGAMGNTGAMGAMGS